VLPAAKQNMTHWPLQYGNGQEALANLPAGYLICRQILIPAASEHGWCVRIKGTAGRRSEITRPEQTYRTPENRRSLSWLMISPAMNTA
jgi:hypothetical protein